MASTSRQFLQHHFFLVGELFIGGTDALSCVEHVVHCTPIVLKMHNLKCVESRRYKLHLKIMGLQSAASRLAFIGLGLGRNWGCRFGTFADDMTIIRVCSCCVLQQQSLAVLT